jgi:hypothetical protein
MSPIPEVVDEIEETVYGATPNEFSVMERSARRSYGGRYPHGSYPFVFLLL